MARKYVQADAELSEPYPVHLDVSLDDRTSTQIDSDVDARGRVPREQMITVDD